MGNGRSSRRHAGSHSRSLAPTSSAPGASQRSGANGRSNVSVHRGGNRASISRGAAAQQPTSPVRCPRCRRLLQPPSGHERFLCPCGQMLMAPSPQRAAAQQPQAAAAPQRAPAAPQHVRCPTCNTTLAPPPGAPVFRCPCGTHLRAPNVLAMQQSTRGLAAPGGSSKEIGADLVSSDMVASYVERRAEQQWMREPAEDGAALVWKNLQSDEEERRKFMLEEACLQNLADNVAKLNTKQLYEKLEAMCISTEACENKDDLQAALRAAPDTLKALPAHELEARLEALGVSIDDLAGGVEELANRLLAAAWYDGLYDDGYVRAIQPDDSLAWIPAAKYRLAVVGVSMSARDLWHVSAQPFSEKIKWFSQQVKALKTPWEKGHAQVKVRRHELLRDAFTTFNKLRPEDMRRHFRFEFIGEPGLDAGGVAREFFELVSDSMFNVDFGLFEYSGVDNICYSINPSSGIANELDMRYFYFLGRLMGKALFEGHVIPGHLTRPMYKHLLGFPITASDIEFVDPVVYKSMMDIKACDDVEYLYLDFTTATRVFGETQTVELKPGGADIEVTNENREQYLHLLVKFIMFDRIAPQLAMLLRGFYEVIPAPLLTVFDYQELELLMCGLPNIDVDDWRNNTTYRGKFQAKGLKHPVVGWFWETIAEFSQEQRAKFLQFATGTSRVPVQGFGSLQSSDGNIKLFTIDSIEFSKSVFPRSHTCFNRIDLPVYPNKQQLKRYILQALSLEGVGFADE